MWNMKSQGKNVEMRSHREEVVEVYDVRSAECDGDGHGKVRKVGIVTELL